MMGLLWVVGLGLWACWALRLFDSALMVGLVAVVATTQLVPVLVLYYNQQHGMTDAALRGDGLIPDDLLRKFADHQAVVTLEQFVRVSELLWSSNEQAVKEKISVEMVQTFVMMFGVLVLSAVGFLLSRLSMVLALLVYVSSVSNLCHLQSADLVRSNAFVLTGLLMLPLLSSHVRYQNISALAVCFSLFSMGYMNLETNLVLAGPIIIWLGVISLFLYDLLVRIGALELGSLVLCSGIYVFATLLIVNFAVEASGKRSGVSGNSLTWNQVYERLESCQSLHGCFAQDEIDATMPGLVGALFCTGRLVRLFVAGHFRVALLAMLVAVTGFGSVIAMEQRSYLEYPSFFMMVAAVALFGSELSVKSSQKNEASSSRLFKLNWVGFDTNETEETSMESPMPDFLSPNKTLVKRVSSTPSPERLTDDFASPLNTPQAGGQSEGVSNGDKSPQSPNLDISTDSSTTTSEKPPPTANAEEISPQTEDAKAAYMKHKASYEKAKKVHDQLLKRKFQFEAMANGLGEHTPEQKLAIQKKLAAATRDVEAAKKALRAKEKLAKLAKNELVDPS